MLLNRSLDGPTLVVVLALLTGAATAVSGQTLSGVVLEVGSDHSVPLAEVSVLDTAGNVVRRGFTDAAGQFLFELDRPGTYAIRAVRRGFNPATAAAVQVSGEQELALMIRLQPGPMGLDSVTIPEGHLIGLEMVGFYARAQEGEGTFFARADIEAMEDVSTLVDVVRTVPRMYVRPGRFGRDLLMLRTLSGDRCRPIFLIDGVRATRRSWDEGMLDLSAIAGVEVYVGTDRVPRSLHDRVPESRYYVRAGRTNCSLVVVWSREGQARQQ